jgi:hypothetical protein
MTSRERLQALLAEWNVPAAMQEIIKLAIDAAVAEEREACAAEAQKCADRGHSGIAAQAIRARGAK